jgi:hypothetical protein
VCVSNDAFEQRAYELSKEIQEKTIYNFIRVEGAGGKEIALENGCQSTHLELITKVFLEDDEGTVYCVEPNVNGIRFAIGEISFKEYNKVQRKEMNQLLTVFTGVVGTFVLAGWAFIQFVM